MKQQKMNHISICIEEWLNELLIAKAKSKGVSRSEIIRNLIKDSLIRVPQRQFKKTGYFNDSKGILRSVNKQ